MNRLRLARAKKNISQTELSNLSNIPQPRISHIENNHWIPSEVEEIRLSNALVVERHWLFPEEDLR